MDHTQPKKTIQAFAQPYRTKHGNSVIQENNPVKDLTLHDRTIPNSTMED